MTITKQSLLNEYGYNSALSFEKEKLQWRLQKSAEILGIILLFMGGWLPLSSFQIGDALLVKNSAIALSALATIPLALTIIFGIQMRNFLSKELDEGEVKKVRAKEENLLHAKNNWISLLKQAPEDEGKNLLQYAYEMKALFSDYNKSNRGWSIYSYTTKLLADKHRTIKLSQIATLLILIFSLVMTATCHLSTQNIGLLWKITAGAVGVPITIILHQIYGIYIKKGGWKSIDEPLLERLEGTIQGIKKRVNEAKDNAHLSRGGNESL